jgi:hypothetical protein
MAKSHDRYVLTAAVAHGPHRDAGRAAVAGGNARALFRL